MENKAHSELSKVQDIISTKDEELQAAEESLSGLKEVTHFSSNRMRMGYFFHFHIFPSQVCSIAGIRL